MRVYAIAVNTFKEVIRDKIFYSLVFFALMILAVSVLMSELTVGERAKIIVDVSLAGINIFGVIISIFVGIGLVSKEIEKKTVYTIISKPIDRSEFLLGKFLGLSLVLLAYVSVMSVVFLAVLYMFTHAWGGPMLLAVVLIYVELLVVTAAALLFSTFSTPTLSATYTLAVYIIGHLTADLKGLAAKAEAEGAKAVLEFLYYALPNLENFNIKGKVAHGVEVGTGYMLTVGAYGLFYVSALLIVASLIFRKRNFK